MDRKQFVQALDLAARLVFSPEEPVAFTGKSLRDILHSLRHVAQNSDMSDEALLAFWKANTEDFRKSLIQTAKADKSTVIFEDQSLVLIREKDAAKLRNRCPQGPNYDYPDKRG